MSLGMRIFWSLLLGVVILLVAFSRMKESSYVMEADEGHYYHYAQVFNQHGFEGIKKEILHYFNHRESMLYPPPTRFGYIALTGTFMSFWPSWHMFGAVSLAFYLLTILLNFIYSRRYFAIEAAFVATLFLAASPLVMAMSRRALNDECILFLWCWAMWLWIDYLYKRQWPALYMFLLTVILGLWFKESSIILLIFAVVSACFTPLLKLKPIRLLDIGLIIFAGLFGYLIIPSLIFGIKIWPQAIYILHKVQGHLANINPYVKNYCSGPWFRYILDAFILQAPIVLMSFAWLGLMFSRRVPVTVPLWLTVLFYIIIYIPLCFLQKNIRYAIALEPLYAMWAALFLLELKAAYRWRDQGVFLLTVLIVIGNILVFKKIFLANQLYDPVSTHLLSIFKIIYN